MNLLIDSKLCVTPHRIAIDDLPDSDGEVRVLTIVLEGDQRVAVRSHRRNTRRAYRSAPASDASEPCILPFSRS
ncbi:hypothetical protein AYO47_03605 [Planctomyces sp. SCGC AG-212-M04]|nr:hypothetical protein AYO47_03605 [Planctomyces sp. SCGC AG-212-M04]